MSAGWRLVGILELQDQAALPAHVLTTLLLQEPEPTSAAPLTATSAAASAETPRPSQTASGR
jgi:hypothetical protein